MLAKFPSTGRSSPPIGPARGGASGSITSTPAATTGSSGRRSRIVRRRASSSPRSRKARRPPPPGSRRVSLIRPVGDRPVLTPQAFAEAVAEQDGPVTLETDHRPDDRRERSAPPLGGRAGTRARRAASVVPRSCWSRSGDIRLTAPVRGSDRRRSSSLGLSPIRSTRRSHSVRGRDEPSDHALTDWSRFRSFVPDQR